MRDQSRGSSNWWEANIAAVQNIMDIWTKYNMPEIAYLLTVNFEKKIFKKWTIFFPCTENATHESGKAYVCKGIVKNGLGSIQSHLTPSQTSLKLIKPMYCFLFAIFFYQLGIIIRKIEVELEKSYSISNLLGQSWAGRNWLDPLWEAIIVLENLGWQH